MRTQRTWPQHAVLLIFVVLTLAPFVFVVVNSFRTNSEYFRAFIGFPGAATEIIEATAQKLGGGFPDSGPGYGEVVGEKADLLTDGYQLSWEYIRPYLLNTFFVAGVTIFGVIMISSLSAYVFSRYRFPGHRFLFIALLSIMMVPGILTLVPSFLLVKELGLLNSYWVLILPYIATGQIVAIFLFKTFFDGLPRELFESARMDGAGHFSLYFFIVLPLSKPIISVVAIITLLASWNNFLWPFITNSDSKYHVVTSGLFIMTQTQVAANYSTMNAAYIVVSIPLLIIFLYATKPFIAGVTSGALK